ncbi:MAG: restriction endonuclease subunit M [Erysipelotrichia bacterium]|nr:restriction endonuclease subunit M [Erysipelotrichia bacterium]
MKAIMLFDELLENNDLNYIATKLNLHIGTVRRWKKNNSVPNNYYNDLNALLSNKYENKEEYRDKDQFYTTKATAEYCYKKTLEILKKLEINEKEYIYIEPSAGCCNFYSLLPKKRRIGIDIDPKGELKDELIESNYLLYNPEKGKKYIVLGNPPFGLRGNLALRFINHSYDFADVVAFILPPLFNSTGKGVPMKRVKGYKLAHTEKLPRNSYEYPDGTLVDVATIFQVWTKVNTEKIETKEIKTCVSYAKVYSLSDGGTPASTRNKKMLNKCDVYLPSTCFKGMQAYDNFESLPNRRGYGVVFKKEKHKLMKLFYKKINWEKVAFISTNGALNLRTDLIMNQITEGGYYDE